MIRFTCIAVLLALLPALRAEVEFVGILATPQKTLFALTDTVTTKSDWVAMGGVFSGYTIGGFDAKNDLLTLAKNGVETRVRLKDDAKVKAARLELTGSITFGATEKLEIARATLQFDQENVFPLKDGITYRITPQRRSDGTIAYRIGIERALAANKTERLSAPSVIAMPGQPFRLQLDDLGFAFTPRYP
jgi:hypothetical protein